VSACVGECVFAYGRADARTRVCVNEFSFPFLFGFLVCGFFFFVSFFVFYFVFRFFIFAFLFSIFCFCCGKGK